MTKIWTRQNLKHLQTTNKKASEFGENVRYPHFLLFPQIFHKSPSSGSLILGIIGITLSGFKQKILSLREKLSEPNRYRA